MYSSRTTFNKFLLDYVSERNFLAESVSEKVKETNELFKQIRENKPSWIKARSTEPQRAFVEMQETAAKIEEVRAKLRYLSCKAKLLNENIEMRLDCLQRNGNYETRSYTRESLFLYQFLSEMTTLCTLISNQESVINKFLASFDETLESFIQILGKENITKYCFNQLTGRPGFSMATLKSEAGETLLHNLMLLADRVGCGGEDNNNRGMGKLIRSSIEYHFLGAKRHRDQREKSVEQNVAVNRICPNSATQTILSKRSCVRD